MREIQRLDIYKESINKEIVPCISGNLSINFSSVKRFVLI